MKRFIRKLSIILFILLFTISLTTINVNANINKNVLFISSYSPEFISFHDQVRGITDTLDKNITLQIEYMDFRKFETEENERNFYALLKYKLSKYNDIDAIIVGDDPALKFAMKYRYDLFDDIPIVFLGINDLELGQNATKERQVYGILEEPSIRENVETIIKVHNPKNIYMVTDQSILHSNEVEEFNSLKTIYKDINFNIIKLNELSFNEFIGMLKNKNRDDALLLVYAFKDKSGAQIDTSVMVNMIEENTNAPIYTALEYFMGKNSIGGKVISHYEHGKRAAEIVEKIINNEMILDKLVSSNDVNKSVYNYNQLKKYNISKKDIEPNSIIIGDPLDDLVKQKNVIIPAVIIVCSLIITIMILLRNTHKRRQYEIQLLKAKEAAEAYNKTKNHFISNISHELRTPVTVIMSSIDLLKLNLQKVESTNYSNNKRNLDIIKQNCFRQLRLINNLIDIAKTEAGYANLNLKNVEIIYEIENIVASVIPYGEKKNLNIIFDTSHEEIVMAVDVEKLERIMLNLLSNAIKFTKADGTILINILKETEYLRISVQDNGIGISEENISKIFEKFVQLDETMTRENEGSGIGLSIVDSFVKLHGGKIEVVSEINKGTTFIIKLPMKKISTSKQEPQYLEFGESTIDNTNIELSDIYI